MKIAVKIDCPACHHKHEIEFTLETLMDMLEALEKAQGRERKREAPGVAELRDLMDMFGMS